MGKKTKTSYKKGCIPWNKGVFKNKNTNKNKMFQAHIGRLPYRMSDDVKEKISKTQKENYALDNPLNLRGRISNTIKIKFKTDKKYRDKVRLGRGKTLKALSLKPNYSEINLMSLLDKMFPKEWKYVGNFKVWLGNKNPDFINVNGKKKLIELFGEKWHKPEDEQIRKKHFKKYGFNTLVIWAKELKDETKLKEKLMYFCQ